MPSPYRRRSNQYNMLNDSDSALQQPGPGSSYGGEFYAPRSLLEIQQRLAALEAILASRADDGK
jgi:hypothetical protein